MLTGRSLREPAAAGDRSVIRTDKHPGTRRRAQEVYPFGLRSLIDEKKGVVGRSFADPPPTPFVCSDAIGAGFKNVDAIKILT
jgi:hypothetical protein